MLLVWLFLYSCTGCHADLEVIRGPTLGGVFVGALFLEQVRRSSAWLGLGFGFGFGFGLGVGLGLGLGLANRARTGPTA